MVQSGESLIPLRSRKTTTSRLASTPPGVPGATPTSSAWSTSTSPWSPTSGPRSSPAPRARANKAPAGAGRGTKEAFERHLADAYAALLSGAGRGRARRPELVVLVSHEVVKRGWTDVREKELCKIPGVGPVSPEVARKIARDAFVSGVFYDGKDLRHFARWTRNIPIEALVALELGEPPLFDGVCCVDCGNRFRTEFDHVRPRVAHGHTSKPNLEPRCWSCHRAKTARDRRAARLRPPEP